MEGLSFYNTFADIVAQHTLQWTQGFQPGSDRVLPPTPEQFAKDLADEARAFGINFPGSTIGAGLIQQAVDAYKATYALILLLKLPSNPSDGYAKWYAETHPE